MLLVNIVVWSREGRRIASSTVHGSWESDQTNGTDRLH